MPNAAPVLYQWTMRAYGLSHSNDSGSQVPPCGMLARTSHFVHWSSATITAAIVAIGQYLWITLFTLHLASKIAPFYHYSLIYRRGTRALILVRTSYSFVPVHSARS